MMNDSGTSALPTGLSQAEPEEVSALRASIPSAARQVDQRASVSEPYHDDHFSPGAGMLRLQQHDTRHGTWWSGDFVDYRGIVSIQMEDRYLRLDVVAGGKCRVRTFGRGFGDRTVAKLCRAFLTDLFGVPALGLPDGPVWCVRVSGGLPKGENAEGG